MMCERDLLKVKQLSRETIALCDQVLEEEDLLVRLTGSKKTGSLRRKSMDLTRALADLRRA